MVGVLLLPVGEGESGVGEKEGFEEGGFGLDGVGAREVPDFKVVPAFDLTNGSAAAGANIFAFPVLFVKLYARPHIVASANIEDVRIG